MFRLVVEALNDNGLAADFDDAGFQDDDVEADELDDALKEADEEPDDCFFECGGDLEGVVDVEAGALALVAATGAKNTCIASSGSAISLLFFRAAHHSALA